MAELIIVKNAKYSLNCKETRRNNNVLVVGASGAGKTTGIVIPNILQAEGSYIISDPKGNLYEKYKDYLIDKGYVVKKLDFTNPKSSIKYNPFKYIKNTQDMTSMAHTLVYSHGGSMQDPFWELSSTVLLSSLIAFTKESYEPRKQDIGTVFELLSLADKFDDAGIVKNDLDKMMEVLHKKSPNSFAFKQYKKFRVGAERTYDSIANVFFTQAIQELCRCADALPNSELKVPVRFILDDFATNVCITDFPIIISSIRSRNISAMLMLQAESQLDAFYNEDAKTIISNCDTYCYLGGNDLDTAKSISARTNLPLEKILSMPVSEMFIFRRGEKMIKDTIIGIDDYAPML